MLAIAKVTIAAVLLSAVFAVERPCCNSKKWTGKLQIITAYLVNGSTVPVMTDNTLSLDYDRDMKMERAIGTIRTINGTMDTTNNYTTYNDFGNMKRYVMSGMDSCRVEMLTDEQVDPCVPSTLQYGGSYRIGSAKSNVTVNAWYGMVDNYEMTMTTDIEDCTPVTVSRFGMGEHGTRFTQNIVYADVTQYMTNQGALDIPDACKTGGMAIGK